MEGGVMLEFGMAGRDGVPRRGGPRPRRSTWVLSIGLAVSTLACDDDPGLGGGLLADGGSDAVMDGGSAPLSDAGGDAFTLDPGRPAAPPPNLPAPSKAPVEGGVIVAVSHDLLISVSRDSGTTWTTVLHQPGLPENQMLLIRSSYANGFYFATGWRFFRSSDAATFTELALPTKQWFGDVVFGGGTYLTGGGWGSFMTSTDGTVWKQGKLPGIEKSITSVAFGNGRFAMSLEDGTVYLSDEGTTWVVDQALTTTNLAFCEGAFRDGSACQRPDPAESLWQGHGYWYFARWPDTLMRSSDGKNFQPIATFPAGIRDLSFGGEP